MPEIVRFYRHEESGERPWRVDVDDQTINFRREDEALRAARMLAGPGCLLFIDRREVDEQNVETTQINAKGD